MIIIKFIKGSTFAGLIFPYFADAYGRKRTMISAVIVGGFSVFLCGFVYSIYFFMVFIFIAGFCLNGFEAIVLVYVTEISGLIILKLKKKIVYNFKFFILRGTI